MSLLDEITGAHEPILRPSGGCSSCPRKRINYVPASLRPGSVIFVDDSPGDSEVAAQEGFSGQAGALLRSVAKECGIPEPWSFTSTTHCKPAGEKAQPKEISCCLAQFVLDEIRDYSIVVLCGSVPLQALFPGAKATHYRGNVVWHPDFPGQRFYAIYHPGYILKHDDLKADFYQQMQRLARIANGEAQTAPAWQIVRGGAALTELREMVKRPLISLDYETDRLESWVEGGHIKSLAATADAKTIVVAHESEPHFKPMLKLIGEFITKEEKSIVGSHISFDLEWTERELGVRARCQLIHDTGIEWYHAGQYKMPSLKELVSRELDGYRFLIHEPHKSKDADLLLRYNAEDVVHPLHLMKKAMTKLKPKTRDLVARVLGPADLILQRISADGIYVRDDYRRAKVEEYSENRRQVIDRWKSIDPEFIPDLHESGDGLLHYLFTMRKLPVYGWTGDNDGEGQPSTDKSHLKQYVRDGFAFVQPLLDMREIDTIDSMFLSGYAKHLWPDSRVRTNYPLTWTDSGRTSSRQPNLQNIPRKKEIRDIFGAPPGSILVESDLSQIEFRMMVCLAKDENGIRGYMRGEDAHTMTARLITGNETPTKAQRTDAKPVNFGFLYGAQAGTVKQIAADDYNVIWTDKQAQDFRTLFMATYPAIPIFHETARALLIKNRGWFESAVGHIFRYDEWNHKNRGKQDHAFRAALNAEAQGPAAQLCLYIMVLSRRLLDQRGFGTVKFVNHVHDSMMSEVPDPAWVPDVVDTITEATALAREWVQDWFVVPLLLEHAYGESWGSLTEIRKAA